MDLEKQSQEKQNFSEAENDLNLININPTRKNILDNDNDVDEPLSKGLNETESVIEAQNSLIEAKNKIVEKLTSIVNLEHETDLNEDESKPDTEIKPKKKAKRIAIIDSDSEGELNSQIGNENEDATQISEGNQNENYDSQLEENNQNSNEEICKKKPKRIAIIDSDSEDEAPISPHNKIFNDELSTPQTNNDTSVYIINEKGNLVAENDTNVLQEDVTKKSRFAALCDSESSEDEGRYTAINVESPQKDKKYTKSVKKSNSKTPAEKPSGKKMSGKQALQQRQEIRSESQRMLRESRISLPYHKPKARSIKEFLQNRPRLSLSMVNTDNTPPSVAIKMSVQELEIVTKKLEERGKVVQEFYKSESESDEEEVLTENAKRVDQEKSGDDKKETVENSEVTLEDKEISNDENGEVTNSENKENLNTSESLEENIRKEIVQDSSIQTEYREKTDSDTSTIEFKINDNAIEKLDSIKENQEIPVKININISNTNVKRKLLVTFNNNEDCLKVPANDNTELEKNISNNFENNTNTTRAQEESPISLGGAPASSINPAVNDHEIEQSNKQPINVTEEFEDSVDFDFNLDGLEEDSSATENICEVSEKNSELKEKGPEEQYLQRLLEKYEDNPDDNNYLKLTTTNEKKLNKIEILKQVGTTKPSLSGGPDEVIDLGEGTSKSSGVAQLMERFMKHALRKNVVKHKVQLDIINLTQGEVVKETVAMSVDPEEEPIVILETPGIKLKKLRDELQSQMAQRRSELWQQKHQPLDENLSKNTYDDEKSDCGADEDILDDEEEAELSDIEDEEEEDEYEEEVRKGLMKPKVKSAFIDEEAEETDAEDDGVSERNDEEEEEDEKPEKSDDTVQEDSNDVQNITIKKPLRRILQGFTEDSDEEEQSQSAFNAPAVNPENKNASFTSLNSTDSFSDNDTVLPNQPRTDKTPHKEMTQSKAAVFGLLTPVQHLTGLQGFNSGSKFLREESPVSPFLLPPDPSPFKDKMWNKDLQKKLFSDSNDALDSDANMDDIAQLCSGKFPTQTQPIHRADSACSNSVSESLATQDVISMCSGSFPDITVAAEKDHQEKNFDASLLINEDTSDKTEPLVKKGSILQVNLNSNEEIKSLDDDKLISQLLDEEEMEQFKKKFESPIAPILSRLNDYESEMEVTGGGRLVSDSSDDESEQPKNAKKLQKRLAFSDDSDSEDQEDEDKEEINLHDNCSDDDNTNTNRIIDYDSEENEIVPDNEDEAPKQRLKLNDFLENEAELSESDWDSADEDEKGLDALEFEQGDADVFDENKMRNDLEKIHMRRVLDQDNQEIKILQEMLLEDGELHGTGRQRQFRWRNIDDPGNDEGGQKDAEIDTYLDEEENEEQWRRARHQREMFLKEKQEKHSLLENDDFISTDSNSQVLKLGQEAVRKSLSAASTLPENPKPTTSSTEVAKPSMLLNTRGSFLARNDKFLTKLAEFTKITTTTTGGSSKTTKKIVFQAVSTNETTLVNNKRKFDNEDKTPKILKKLRLSSNLTPVIKNVDRKKKLFK